MAKIRSKNTKPEKMLRSRLHKAGFRFRIHRNDLPGKPDIVFSKQKVIVFVHGCFWHFHKDCREGRIPSSNSVFWENKLKRNIRTDQRNIEKLRIDGWKVIVIWECEIENNLEESMKKVLSNFYHIQSLASI
jgi:DNA mismatch endonuclease (patch repair protein)